MKKNWNDLTFEERMLNIRQIDETYDYASYDTPADAAYNIRIGYENDPEWFAFTVTDLDKFETDAAGLINLLSYAFIIHDREGLGQYLRQCRISQGISIRGMASLSGLTPSTIQNVEAGAFTPRLDIILKITQALDKKLCIE